MRNFFRMACVLAGVLLVALVTPIAAEEVGSSSASVHEVSSKSANVIELALRANAQMDMLENILEETAAERKEHWHDIVGARESMADLRSRIKGLVRSELLKEVSTLRLVTLSPHEFSVRVKKILDAAREAGVDRDTQGLAIDVIMGIAAQNAIRHEDEIRDARDKLNGDL